jgi:hypothetical protein
VSSPGLRDAVVRIRARVVAWSCCPLAEWLAGVRESECAQRRCGAEQRVQSSAGTGRNMQACECRPISALTLASLGSGALLSVCHSISPTDEPTGSHARGAMMEPDAPPAPSVEVAAPAEVTSVTDPPATEPAVPAAATPHTASSDAVSVTTAPVAPPPASAPRPAHVPAPMPKITLIPQQPWRIENAGDDAVYYFRLPSVCSREKFARPCVARIERG